MAYLQVALTNMLQLRLNEPGRRFTALGALSTWVNPRDGALYVNHKSASEFSKQATELSFSGRSGHKHAIALARESDHVILAVIEVNEAGIVSMRHANSPTTRSGMANGGFEHLAIIVGCPSEQFTMNIYDVKHTDTDIVRYRPVDGKFYIPSQYLHPEQRITMASRTSAIQAIQQAGRIDSGAYNRMTQASSSAFIPTTVAASPISPSMLSVQSRLHFSTQTDTGAEQTSVVNVLNANAHEMSAGNTSKVETSPIETTSPNVLFQIMTDQGGKRNVTVAERTLMTGRRPKSESPDEDSENQAESKEQTTEEEMDDQSTDDKTSGDDYVA